MQSLEKKGKHRNKGKLIDEEDKSGSALDTMVKTPVITDRNPETF